MPSLSELLNGKLVLIRNIVALVTVVVATTLWFESRYAKAADVQAVQRKVQQVEQDTHLLIDVYKIEKRSRLAVLQLKAAQGGLTPAEEVELDSLEEIIDKIDKAHEGEPER